MDNDTTERLGSPSDVAIRGRALETAFIALARCLQRDQPGLLHRALAEVTAMASNSVRTEETVQEEAARFVHAEAILRTALMQAEGEE